MVSTNNKYRTKKPTDQPLGLRLNAVPNANYGEESKGTDIACIAFNYSWSAFNHALANPETAAELFTKLSEFPFSSLPVIHRSMSGKVLDSFCTFVGKLYQVRYGFILLVSYTY